MHFCDGQHRFQKFVHAFARDGAGRNDFYVAAPSRRSQSEFRHLRHDAIDVRTWQVAFVCSHDNRNPSRLRVRDRFFGLRHDAVVRCDDQDCNIGDVGTASTHFGKRFVTRRVHKGNGSTIFLYLISPDLLRDPARFARYDLGSDQIIEQRCLAVVDVTKESYDWRSSDQVLVAVLDVIHLADQARFKRLRLSELELNTEIGCDQFRLSLIEIGIDVLHRSHGH